MKYHAYAAYKDSGVEWLGDVPEHWEVKQAKHVFILQRGHDLSSDKFIEGIYPVFGSNGSIGHHNEYTTNAPSLTVGRSGSVGEVNYIEENFWAHNTSLYLKEVKNSEVKFIYYLLLAMDIKSLSAGSAVGSLDRNNIHAINIIHPKITEQQTISNFLDHETAKIDTLIEKQRRLIELLKEKRQAVISHAVTKGLNPNAPMKDSGVEWLGEVPEHWEVKRLKNVAEVIDCRNKTPEYFEDGEYLVIRTTNVKSQELNMNGALYTDEKNFKIWTQRGVPPAGSILFTREAPSGEICLVPENLKFCLGQRMMNFICHDSEYANYLFDFLLSDCLERYIESVSHGSTVSHLRVEQVENIPVLVVPYDEAKQIHESLSEIKAKYLRLTEKSNSAIELMQERRTALISAAVTGKIDVRDWRE